MTQKIGQMLIDKGILNQDQLDAALQDQARNGGFLGEILMRLGYVEEEILLKALASQFNTRFVSLEKLKINPTVLKLIPSSLAWEHQFMPLDMRQSILLIAVSNPLDMWPMNAIQERLDISEVQTVLAKKEDIKNALSKHYGPDTAGGF